MNPKSSKPSPKRRAILQGSLAAPVVLTVSSPAAAQMTTLGRCLANLQNAPKPNYLVDEASDTWLRLQVPVYRLTEPNKSVISEYAFFDEALGKFREVGSPHPEVNFPSGVNLHNLTKTEVGKRWGLQWVDDKAKVASGKIQIEPPSGYRAVTGTCWTSFASQKA